MIKYIYIVILTGLCSFGHAELYWGDIVDYKDLEKNDFTRPPGAYKKLMQWKLPLLNSKVVYQCLIYKVPRSKGSGEFFLNSYYEQGCFIGKEFKEESLLKVNSPKQLKVKTKSDYSGLHIQIIVKNKIIKMSFPQGVKHKRWKSLTFYSENASMKKNEVKKTLSKGSYCMTWDKECELSSPKGMCKQCENGLWSETLNYKQCPSRVVGICGEASCGSKNEVACLKMISLKFPITCEEALSFVTCSPLLSAYCEGSGEIICR